MSSSYPNIPAYATSARVLRGVILPFWWFGEAVTGADIEDSV